MSRTATTQALCVVAHVLHDLWHQDLARHFGDHGIALVLADLLTALAAEDYEQATTILAAIDGLAALEDQPRN